MLGLPNLTKGVLTLQFCMIVMLLISTFSFNPQAGVSVLFGGIVSIIPAWVFRKFFFKSRHSSVSDPRQLLKAFYWGELFKYLTLIVLFVFVLTLNILNPLVFFFAFVLTELVHWGYCFFSLVSTSKAWINSELTTGTPK